MDAAAAVAIGAAVLAAIVAVLVPWFTFRLALRQDHQRWLREQRTALYVDLLAEAHAEARYIMHATAEPEVRELAAELFKAIDTRLPPADRARLGARGSIFGSRAVNRLFNELQAAGSQATLAPGNGDGGLAVSFRVDDLFDKLQDAVRHELGADRIGL